MPTLARIFKYGESPCEKYNCEMANICKTKKMACVSFRGYASENLMKRPQTPTKAMYDWIYSGGEGG
jgi:hypothetical protein